MAKLLKLRRGTDTQHNSFTGAEGEVTVNTTNDSLHVHDGTTAGGTELAKADLSNVDGSLSNSLGFADNTKAQFGNSNDLQIYHNGGHNYIDGADGQNLYINSGDHVVIRNGTTNETSAKFLENGKVELRYDDAIKFQTTSTGIDVTGTVTCDGLTNDGDVTVQSANGTLIVKDTDNDGVAAVQQVLGRDSQNNTDWFVGQVGTTNNHVYLSNNNSAAVIFRTGAAERAYFNPDGHFLPWADDSYDLGSVSNQWRNAYIDGTVNCDALSCGGDATFDNGTSTTVNVICDNNGRAEIRSMGDDQGTGVFYAGQNSNTGGGIFYNGDGTPQYATGEASDRVSFFRRSSGTNEVVFSYSYNNNTTVFRGNVLPSANNSFDLGDGSNRWRNVYTNDLNLSNEGGTNDVDGTWGSWTIQEGEDDLFLLNRRNGKKYKFNLSEVN